MKNKIELSKSNYKNYLPINIMAFSYANGGAQGEPGGIIILDNEGKFFHLNYETGDLKPDEIYEICPPLKEINNNSKKFDEMNKGKGNICEICPALKQIILKNNTEKFEEMNMGMGNKLFVNKSIFPEVKEKTKDITRPNMLYIRWKNIILDIIKK